MYGHLGTHALRQGVKDLESIVVVPRCLVGDQNIGAQVGQVVEFIGVNRRPVFSMNTVAPPVLPWGDLGVTLG